MNGVTAPTITAGPMARPCEPAMPFKMTGRVGRSDDAGRVLLVPAGWTTASSRCLACPSPRSDASPNFEAISPPIACTASSEPGPRAVICTTVPLAPQRSRTPITLLALAF